AQITSSGSNKSARTGLNMRSARTSWTSATLAATPAIACSSHSYVRAVPIRTSPTRTHGPTCLVHAHGSILLQGVFLGALMETGNQPRPITPATYMTAHRTGFALISVI